MDQLNCHLFRGKFIPELPNTKEIHFKDFIECFSHIGHDIICKLCDAGSPNRVMYNGERVVLYNILVVILLHIRLYHNVKPNNLMPHRVGNAYVNTSDYVSSWISNNYQVMFINNNIGNIEREDDLMEKITNSNYSCMICGKYFDCLPTKEITLIHIRNCINSHQHINERD